MSEKSSEGDTEVPGLNTSSDYDDVSQGNNGNGLQANGHEELNTDQKIQQFQEFQNETLARVLSDIQLSQQAVVKELKEQVVKGFEKVAEIRYGSQAREYTAESRQERTDLKLQITEIIDNMKRDREDHKQQMIDLREDHIRQIINLERKFDEQMKAVTVTYEQHILTLSNSFDRQTRELNRSIDTNFCKLTDVLSGHLAAISATSNQIPLDMQGNHAEMVKAISSSHKKMDKTIASGMTQLADATKAGIETQTAIARDVIGSFMDAVEQMTQTQRSQNAHLVDCIEQRVVQQIQETAIKLESTAEALQGTTGYSPQQMQDIKPSTMIASNTQVKSTIVDPQVELLKEELMQEKSRSKELEKQIKERKHKKKKKKHKKKHASDTESDSDKAKKKAKKTKRKKGKGDTDSDSDSDTSSSSSSSDDFADDDSDSESNSSYHGARPKRYSKHAGKARRVHIVPFAGKEKWQVWFARFKEIAKREHWTDQEKLDKLIPKLQGEAGEFVFDQLDGKTRKNYKALKKELNSRFRKVENPKTYEVAFSARTQRSTETPEVFAAELKRLYDKAHKNRDKRTREEDLLRRFLDGLWDTEARFQVEYNRKPTTIDQAVDDVVNYLEMKKKHSRPSQRARRTNDHYSSSEDDEDDFEPISRAVGRPPKFRPANGKRNGQMIDDTSKLDPPKDQSQTSGSSEKATPDSSSGILDKVMKEMQGMIKEELAKKDQDYDQDNQNKPYRGRNQNRYYSNRRDQQHKLSQQQQQPQMQNQQQQQPGVYNVPICFKCNEPGHYAPNCTRPVVMGHLQMLAGASQATQNQANLVTVQSDEAFDAQACQVQVSSPSCPHHTANQGNISTSNSAPSPNATSTCTCHQGN